MACRRPSHGFRFKPTDRELMQYLEGFVLGNPLNNTSDFIAVEDLYGEKEPSQIFGTDSDDSIRYYFTQLRRKCEGGSRFLRGVGDRGTWKGQDVGQPIKDNKTKRSVIIGFKKSLRFEFKNSTRKVDDEAWLMKEYSLSDDYLRDKNVVFKDVVLCQIKRVFRNTSRTRESAQNILNENDTPLEIYEWPENNDVTVSLPGGEVSSNGVDDAYRGVGGAMGDDDDNGILIDDDLDKLLTTTPPRDIFNDYIGEVFIGAEGISAMNNDTLLDGLDELLKTIPSDIFNDNSFLASHSAQQDNEEIIHSLPVPNLRRDLFN